MRSRQGTFGYRAVQARKVTAVQVTDQVSRAELERIPSFSHEGDVTPWKGEDGKASLAARLKQRADRKTARDRRSGSIAVVLGPTPDAMRIPGPAALARLVARSTVHHQMEFADPIVGRTFRPAEPLDSMNQFIDRQFIDGCHLGRERSHSRVGVPSTTTYASTFCRSNSAGLARRSDPTRACSMLVASKH